MATNNWLELSEAAEILGVNPSTLRRWSDAGKITHRRTPSGRRQYDRGAVEKARLEMQPAEPQPAAPQIAAEQIELNARELTRQYAGDLAAWKEGWATHLSDEQKLIFRYSGQRLLGLMMQYISRKEKADTFLEEARRIAWDYGEILFKVGLSVSQAAETFLYFRRSIIESVQATSLLGGASDQEGQRTFLRTSDFFDALLVTTIESHVHASQLE
ncbi:MAG TPA: helix-turn-helix domain-containing protein [Anaerolineaceae bacterium]